MSDHDRMFRLNRRKRNGNYPVHPFLHPRFCRGWFEPVRDNLIVMDLTKKTQILRFKIAAFFAILLAIVLFIIFAPSIFR